MNAVSAAHVVYGCGVLGSWSVMRSLESGFGSHMRSVELGPGSDLRSGVEWCFSSSSL